MADYTPAHLRIGGEITSQQYQKIRSLTNDDAEVVVGESYQIWDNQAWNGKFPDLEAYLIAENIPFDRYSEPALGYDGQLAQFRPGMKEPAAFATSGDNMERVVTIAEIEAILSAHPFDQPGGEELLRRLRALCGPAVAPLLPFSVWPD